MEKKASYPWKYTKIGGVTRISIESGQDIAHLPELDQKLWTVLSCPSKGLEFNQKTLDYLDIDSDGHIRVNEVTAAIEWLNKVLRNPENLIKKTDVIELSDINQDTDEGRKVYSSAKQILANLKLDKNSISIDDTSDTVKIFAESKFNGDGIITEASADTDEQKNLIKLVIDNIGKVADRSGADGITKEQVEEFIAEAEAYTQWQSVSKANETLIPYGDNTAAAKAAFIAIKDKVADYFIRCKLVGLDGDTCSALEISKENLAKISEKNLVDAMADIANYPLTRLSDKAVLPINEKINPAWEKQFNDLKKLILDVDFAGKASITEDEWNQIAPKFDAYDKWMADKKGTKVEGVGYDALKAILGSALKDEIMALIEKDLAEKDNAESIQSVNKLTHFHKYIYTFLRNFVTLSDFYHVASTDADNKAIFQCGTLYIDQRECDLCIKVTDMPKHNASAGLSAMYLIYCDCVNTKKGGKIQIVAVITDGGIDNLAIGKNGIFYDREGNDWDATITKIVDNPISIREAFWSPYKKFAGFVEEQINKFASSKDADLTKSMSEKVTESTTKITTAPAAPAADGAPAPEAPKPIKEAQPFDIAKFCGIFAAIGMALGYIGGFLVSVVTGFAELKWWQMILAIVAIILLISGPSMLMAYMKLRRRNLSPLLNANGWAINAQTFVNITFGATLTKLAKFPYVNIKDPLADKGMPWWKKLLIVLVILCIVFAVLYFKNKLGFIGLPFEDEAVPAAAPVEVAVPEQ